LGDQVAQDEPRQREEDLTQRPGAGQDGRDEHLPVAVRPEFQHSQHAGTREKVFELEDLSVHYGDNPAVKRISMEIYKNEITALIGPSGCGKSTLIRCLNRMNDLIPSARVDGKLLYHGEDLYGPNVDPVQVRKLIGMVFQKPNPFPKSIYDNIAFGPRVLKMQGDMDEIVEQALRGAALWEEVKVSSRGSASRAASPSSPR
jgi:phosphate transport system ATP-binding protein